MKNIFGTIGHTTKTLAFALSALAVSILPASASDPEEVVCGEPHGDIEELTLRILEGATEDEVRNAFIRLNALSDSGVEAATNAYNSLAAADDQPATVSMLVNDTATCVRLVVI